MVGYTVALIVASLVLVPVADLGWIYGVTAVAAGARLHRHGGPAAERRRPRTNAMRLFTYSITYVTLLFGAMAVDVFVR